MAGGLPFWGILVEVLGVHLCSHSWFTFLNKVHTSKSTTPKFFSTELNVCVWTVYTPLIRSNLLFFLYLLVDMEKDILSPIKTQSHTCWPWCHIPWQSHKSVHRDGWSQRCAFSVWRWIVKTLSICLDSSFCHSGMGSQITWPYWKKRSEDPNEEMKHGGSMTDRGRREPLRSEKRGRCKRQRCRSGTWQEGEGKERKIKANPIQL